MDRYRRSAIRHPRGRCRLPALLQNEGISLLCLFYTTLTLCTALGLALLFFSCFFSLSLSLYLSSSQSCRTPPLLFFTSRFASRSLMLSHSLLHLCISLCLS